MRRTAVVIGAGVSGLTSAVRLLEAGFGVRVVAKDPPSGTTSSVAAALWYPFRAWPEELVSEWSLVSLERFQQLANDPSTGVRWRKVRELYRGSLPPPSWRERIDGFRVLDAGETAAPFTNGFELEAPVIDSSRYLPWLLDTIERLGGELELREVRELEDLASDTDLIVNCSGLGARRLCSDESLYPVRGQVVRVPDIGIEQATVDEGSAEAAYVIPRSGDCVLGTTLDENEWELVCTEEKTRDIYERCALLDPRVRDLPVLEVAVGLRPARPEVRLEREQSRSSAVIHNYGHGGSGFTLSWGCAEDVLRLA
jgi:D-amino-acid oxidase